jgi:hypothetical protein
VQVKIKTNLGTNQFPDMPYREGDVKDVPAAIGELLVKRRLAEEIVEFKAVPVVDLKAVPASEPEATTISTPEVPAVKQKPKGGK